MGRLYHSDGRSDSNESLFEESRVRKVVRVGGKSLEVDLLLLKLTVTSEPGLAALETCHHGLVK